MLFYYNFDDLLFVFPALLLSLTVHELAHAYTALILGDDTAKVMGRITLNPLKHIDPIGTLMILIIGFGWAKPVLINPQKLRNPLIDDPIIAFAGPMANFILAFLSVLTIKVLSVNSNIFDYKYLTWIVTFLSFMVFLNVALGVFNLIPIPPLDGSHFLSSVLWKLKPELAVSFSRFGSMLLLILLIMNRFSNSNIIPIGQLVEKIIRGMYLMAGY